MCVNRNVHQACVSLACACSECVRAAACETLQFTDASIENLHL